MTAHTWSASIHSAIEIKIEPVLVSNKRGDPPFYMTRIKIKDTEGNVSEIRVHGPRDGDPLPLILKPEKRQ